MDKLSSNELLLVAYKNLDPDGFDLFYKRNHVLIFNFLLSKLGNRAEAEDALQETFFKIHKAILSYDPNQSALGWVFTIARNTAIDFLRRRNIQKISSESIEQVVFEPKTEEVLAAREYLAEVIFHLSSEERELLQKRFFDEESYEEIAKHFNLREEGARQKISRLLKKLRELS